MRAADFEVLPGEYFSFYGILMRDRALTSVGDFMRDCEIPGRLWAVGDAFPALELDDDYPREPSTLISYPDTVLGRLWRVPSDQDLREQVVEELDMIEGFSLDMPAERCMYLRRKVELVAPSVTAWVYVWNGSYSGLRRVPSGDWRMELDVMSDRRSFR